MNDLTGKEWLQNSFSIWKNLTKTQEEKKLKHPASFSINMVDRVIRTFSKEDWVVLDPFDGIGSTMIAAQKSKRKGIGIELKQEFVDIAKSRVEDLHDIEFITGDSFEIVKEMEPCCVDLCVTSPPYWDILNMKRTADVKENINYSNSKKDIGNIHNYDDFVVSLKNLFADVYKVLKPDRYCIINVMDIRKKSTFYPLHQDLSYALREVGFIYDDLIIWDRQPEYNNMRPLGYPSRFRINKVHEYLLVMYKPKSK